MTFIYEENIGSIIYTATIISETPLSENEMWELVKECGVQYNLMKEIKNDTSN